MWLSLKVNDSTRIALVNRQVISPPWGNLESELKITTTTLLDQTVETASSRSTSLIYKIRSFKTQLETKGDIHPPKDWFSPPDISSHSFRITLTPTGALTTLGKKENIPEAALSRLTSLGENLRSFWVIPPSNAGVGTQWSGIASPCTLNLSKTGRSTVTCNYRMVAQTEQSAQIEGIFTVAIENSKERKNTARGSLSVSLGREKGITKATRISHLGLRRTKVSPSQRSELLLQRF